MSSGIVTALTITAIVGGALFTAWSWWADSHRDVGSVDGMGCRAGRGGAGRPDAT